MMRILARFGSFLNIEIGFRWRFNDVFKIVVAPLDAELYIDGLPMKDHTCSKGRIPLIEVEAACENAIVWPIIIAGWIELALSAPPEPEDRYLEKLSIRVKSFPQFIQQSGQNALSKE